MSEAEATRCSCDGQDGWLIDDMFFPDAARPAGAVGGVDPVVSAIEGYRYRFQSEDELQRGIQEALRQAQIAAEREVRLAPGDIIDFLAGDVGIEVKVSGSPAAIARQLMRYAASPAVSSLVLVTRKAQHARRFPKTIGGKPLRVVALEGSSL